MFFEWPSAQKGSVSIWLDLKISGRFEPLFNFCATINRVIDAFWDLQITNDIKEGHVTLVGVLTPEVHVLRSVPVNHKSVCLTVNKI